MRTNADRLAPIEREGRPAGVLVSLNIRNLGAMVPSAERQPAGYGPNADIFARQIFWGAHS